jgi:hypothetical protein
MAKVKTYWDEIKDQETFYSGGSQGWEVHLRRQSSYRYNPKTHECKEVETLQFAWPFCNGDGISREEKAQVRKDVTTKRKIEKILASASINRNEYQDLRSRIDTSELEQEIIKLYNDGLKGFPLRNYIQQNHLTNSEAHSLFWRM